MTVPKTESVAEVAPVLATVIAPPVKEPAGVAAAMRISTEVAATVPLTGEMVVVGP